MFYMIIFSHKNLLALGVSNIGILAQTTVWGDLTYRVYYGKNKPEEANITYLLHNVLCHVCLISVQSK